MTRFGVYALLALLLVCGGLSFTSLPPRFVGGKKSLALRPSSPSPQEGGDESSGQQQRGAPPGGVSDAMRQKMLNEMRSQGADPNVSAGNPILIISAVVAALVLLGGQGIFY